MVQLVVRRLLVLVPVLFLVSVLSFALIFLVPGDAASTMAGTTASQEQIDAMRGRLGLDDPVIEQYSRWIGDAVQGDLGSSLYNSQDVVEAVAQRLPVTLSMAIGAMVVAVVIAVPAGVLAAVYRGRLIDRLIGLSTASSVALPPYFVGMLLVLVIAVWNSWLPATGNPSMDEGVFDWAKHLILPWVTLALAPAAVFARQLRSAMIGVLGQDYVRTARAKGLRGRAVIFKHAIKNAAIPVVTVIGAQLAYVLGGSAIVEQVFGIAGVGQLAVNAAGRRDLPLLQGIIILSTLVVLACNTIVDLAYGYLNPKVRVQ